MPEVHSGTTAARAAEGERIGSYRVVRRIAAGTTSDVILGLAEGPLGFSRQVALKMMRAGLGTDTHARRMFAREATAYAQLSHTCIVQLFDFFEHQGRLVMALEYVDGPPLHRLIALVKTASVQLNDAAALFITQRLFAALGAAHTAKNKATGEALGVVHRDVNPTNILLPWTGESKLGDFGLAKLTALSGDTRNLSRGTAGYLAPEQARGEDATTRSDVYAAGLVAWELFARRRAHPVGAVSDADLMLSMQAPRVVPLDVLRTDLDRRVREIIRRAIEPDPERRTITAEQAAIEIAETFDADLGRTRLEQVLERIRPLANAERAQPPQSTPTLTQTAPMPSVAPSGAATPKAPSANTKQAAAASAGSSTRIPATKRVLDLSPDTMPNPSSNKMPALGPPRARISTADRDPLALLLSGDRHELGTAIDDILSEGKPSDAVISSAPRARSRPRIDSPPPPISAEALDAMFDRNPQLPGSERRSTAMGIPRAGETGGPPRLGPGLTIPITPKSISFDAGVENERNRGEREEDEDEETIAGPKTMAANPPPPANPRPQIAHPHASSSPPPVVTERFDSRVPPTPPAGSLPLPTPAPRPTAPSTPSTPSTQQPPSATATLFGTPGVPSAPVPSPHALSAPQLTPGRTQIMSPRNMPAAPAAMTPSTPGVGTQTLPLANSAHGRISHPPPVPARASMPPPPPPARSPTLPPATRLNRAERRSHTAAIAIVSLLTVLAAAAMGVLVIRHRARERDLVSRTPASTSAAPKTTFTAPTASPAVALTAAPTASAAPTATATATASAETAPSATTTATAAIAGASAAPTATATAAPVPTTAPAATVAVTPSATSNPAGGTTGMLSTEGTRPGHRIFVDNRVVGETPGVVKVACGTHSVKLGSAAKPQTIDVPCGDRVVVKDH